MLSVNCEVESGDVGEERVGYGNWVGWREEEIFYGINHKTGLFLTSFCSRRKNTQSAQLTTQVWLVGLLVG